MFRNCLRFGLTACEKAGILTNMNIDNCSNCEEEFEVTEPVWNQTGLCPTCEDGYEPSEAQLDRFLSRSGATPTISELILEDIRIEG